MGGSVALSARPTARTVSRTALESLELSVGSVRLASHGAIEPPGMRAASAREGHRNDDASLRDCARSWGRAGGHTSVEAADAPQLPTDLPDTTGSPRVISSADFTGNLGYSVESSVVAPALVPTPE